MHPMINAFGIAIRSDYLFFKIHAIGHPRYAEYILKDIDPIGASVLILVAFAIPFIEKLSCRFPLLHIRHIPTPSIYQ